jgi:hypothetical protein
MPTITIHITVDIPSDDATNGGDFAADLVAHVLTHYCDPAITIDRAGVAARAATTHTVMSPVRHPVIDVIGSHEVRSRETIRAARYAEDDRTYDQTRINVPCPKCQAEPGDPCTNGKGKTYSRPFLHIDRRSAWQQLMITPPAARAATGRPDWMPTVVTLDEM